MSPSIEARTHSEQLCVVIDLNDDAPFDPKEFDTMIKEVDYTFIDGMANESSVKFVVVGGKMYLFPETQNHLKFYAAEIRPHNQGEIQSAGDLKVDHDTGERVIMGFSSSLEANGLLNDKASVKYRKEVIGSKLAEHFDVSPF